MSNACVYPGGDYLLPPLWLTEAEEGRCRAKTTDPPQFAPNLCVLPSDAMHTLPGI